MDVLKYLSERIQLVEKELDRWVPAAEKPKELVGAARHLIQAGGKRLRPGLLLTSCEAVGGKVGDAIEAAAAVELLHNFTLIHDDIMDHDEFRRNVKTVHMLWGEPMAIIAGDALFAKVFQALSANVRRLKLDGFAATEVFNTMSIASFEVCRGQALDMILARQKVVKEKEYLCMVGGKTGALTEASTKIGAILGEGTPKQVQALANYGFSSGVAFQIRDDVLGISGVQEKFGKPIGSDIREGKRTLMVIHALSSVENRKRKILLRALGNKKASEAGIKAAIEVLEDSGSVEYASNRADELIADAKSQLKVLPRSNAREVLFKVADFVIKREF
jgi:geranylgeranyl diphosphate synthase type I